MGMRVIALRSSQTLQLKHFHSHCSFSPSRQPYSVSFPITTNPCGKNAILSRGLVSSSKVSSASFGEFFSDEDLSSRIEELAQMFNLSGDYGHKSEDVETASVGSNISLDMKCPEGESLGVGSLRPSLYVVEPEQSPYWRERSEIDKASIERKANSIELPLSLRLIRMKHKQWKESFKEAGEFTYCSMKKAFSYMVYMLRELQSCALSVRESAYYEDVQEMITKMQREMNVTFVWLFQKVFSPTPTLMVYLMILLANYTVKSMDDNTVGIAAPLPVITETFSWTENEDQQQAKLDDVFIVKKILNGTKVISPSGIGTKEINGVPFLGNEGFNSEEEMELWDSVLVEASRMQRESTAGAVDQETVKQFVSPLSVELEEDDYVDYSRTDLEYQMGLAGDPNNPLLLSNYAQFLYLVYHDHNRAEECFRRAVQAEPPDAEALSRYADFLWIVRKDLWGAEERYQQALAVDPENPCYASKYANFLWNTGGEETCFLDSSHENFKVL